MKFDCHLHTFPFSQDARQSIEELSTTLAEKKIAGILTEHMDFDFPLDPKIVLFDPAAYFEKYQPFRSDTLLLGAEIGLSDSCLEKNKDLIQSFPWDFILVSVHVVDGQDLCNRAFYDANNQEDVYRRYLQKLVRETAALDSYDSVAHIDYICRYNAYPDPNLHYQDFPDLFDSFFQNLIERDKAFELNTRRLAIPGAKESLFVLLQRFRELGGKYITIGSDAHLTRSVGNHLDLAYDMVHQAYLTPVYFNHRQLHYVK